MFSIGKPKVSPKPHQNYCTDVFLTIFTIIVEDLYFTEHYTVAVYLNFTDLYMQRMFHCGNCPFPGNLIYMLFISSNLLGIP